MTKIRLLATAMVLLCTINSFAQTTIDGRVKDSATNESLPFCSITVKGSTKGTITNEEGAFTIFVNLNKDTLLFSYVGYTPQTIPARRLVQKPMVLMNRNNVLLNEVVVHSTDDYIFDVLLRCRKRLSDDPSEHTAKVYYGIETQTKEQPVEQLECYYNGYLKGITIEKLGFKNGRLGLAVLDESYFLTLNTSAAISRLNLIVQSKDYPFIPFQFNKREMKKHFRVALEPSDNKMYRISFQPRKMKQHGFSGEVWIDKESLSILKINLNIENALQHPFLPIFPTDSLSQIHLSINQTFKQEGNTVLPDHFDFRYDAVYKSVRKEPTAGHPSILTRNITTKGIMYFYDYDNPFILPFFEYDNAFDDYRKMSFIPYNDFFWKSNFTLRLTEKQKENLNFFSDKGQLINFGDRRYGRDFLRIQQENDTSFSKLYEFYYTFWSSSERIRLNRKLVQNSVFPLNKRDNAVQSSLYHLKVQLLLDVTQSGDTIDHRSYTVFDAGKTFFHLPEQPCITPFLNIYFDICEIERRKMENELSRKSLTIARVDSIYKRTIENMEAITRRYLKEVELGKNEKSLRVWNDYVIKNLNIDNMALFPLTNDP